MPMLPSDSNTLRLLLGLSRIANTFSYCIFIIDHLGIKAIESETLGSSIGESTANQLCVKSAFHIACSTGRGYSHVELFSPFTSIFSFISPLSKMSSLQRLNRETFFQIADKTSLFTCLPSANNPWFGLANAAAKLGGPCCSSPTLLRPSKEAVKLEIRQSVLSKWDQEWTSSSAGANTRVFFPHVKSASATLKLHLSKQVVQILSGHSFLNSHQHRFNFKDSPACVCGSPIESIEHFLFHCPRFSFPRTRFRAACSNCSVSWPPTLSLIPANRDAWEAMCLFIHQTKRLRRGFS
jgi:hypothetical protein